MLNIGRRPTIQAEGNLVIEANLFGFSNEIYGRELTLHLLRWIRAGKKFGSIEELKEQLRQDRTFSQKFLKEHQFA
jgi:riboflavin kinase/FMN adenylyltransferase